MEHTKLKRIAVLGSTGSIGCNTLKVIEDNPERFSVCALAASSSLEKIRQQALKHPEAFLAMADEKNARALQKSLPNAFAARITWGEEGIAQIIKDSAPDLVVNAISGAAGLSSTVASLEAGIDLALANKESLVMGGGLVMSLARKHKVNIIPVDSEHSALWQVWPQGQSKHIRKLWITGSGGPFLHFTQKQMQDITPAMALNHPTWNMGPKITIDSATLMNKGLEVIEAAFLFDLPLDQIDVVIHPQSLVHGLIEMTDGSFMAQMGMADMCQPISYALSHPARLPASWPVLNIFEMSSLTFMPPDKERFPALKLATNAGLSGGSAPVTLNAANEVAIEAFLKRRIKFTAIAACVEDVLAGQPVQPLNDLADIIEADRLARAKARRWIKNKEI